MATEEVFLTLTHRMGEDRRGGQDKGRGPDEVVRRNLKSDHTDPLSVASQPVRNPFPQIRVTGPWGSKPKLNCPVSCTIRRRPRRVAQACEHYGNSVQKSVFSARLGTRNGRACATGF